MPNQVTPTPNINLPLQPAVCIYKCTLSQVGTGAPTASEIINNANLTVTWTRTGAGNYRATIEDFAGYTVYNATVAFIAQTIPTVEACTVIKDFNAVDVLTFGGGYVDDSLDKASFSMEIKTNLLIIAS